MKGLFSKAKNLGTSVKNAASGAVDDFNDSVAASKEKEMVKALTEKMNETGVCPVCGAVHN